MKLEKRLEAIMMDTLVAMEQTGHRVAAVNERLLDADLKPSEVRSLAGALRSLEVAKARQSKTLQEVGVRLEKMRAAKAAKE